MPFCVTGSESVKQVREGDFLPPCSQSDSPSHKLEMLVLWFCLLTKKEGVLCLIIVLKVKGPTSSTLVITAFAELVTHGMLASGGTWEKYQQRHFLHLLDDEDHDR